jgi:hypothetical protein
MNHMKGQRPAAGSSFTKPAWPITARWNDSVELQGVRQAASAPAYWPINTKLVEPTVAKVKTAILQHALSIALVGIHVLGGVPGLPVATTPAGEPSTRSVQYCVPQDDDPNFTGSAAGGMRPSRIDPKRESTPRTCQPLRSLDKCREHDRVPGVLPPRVRSRPACLPPARRPHCHTVLFASRIMSTHP